VASTPLARSAEAVRFARSTAERAEEATFGEEEGFGMAEADAEAADERVTYSAPWRRAEREPAGSSSPVEVARLERLDARRALRTEPAGRRDPRIQSGTLTAGSFDDHQRFEAYQEFLSKALQEDHAEKLPRLAIGSRVMIEVTGDGGSPIGDARVVVRPVDPQHRGIAPATPALLDLSTGSDGRVVFLTGMDSAGGGREFHVTVHPPDGSQPVAETMHVDQGPWRITLPDTRPRLPEKLDLALVIDTTGSMGDELEYLKVEIDSIAKAVYELFPNVDQRYALVVYRDQGDSYVTRTFDFTGSLAEFRAVLAEQSADGGGDYPEAVHLALDSAVKLDWRARDTARVLFLVADAPPHGQFADRTLEAITGLRHRGVRVFPVASSGVAMEAEFIMRAGAFLTLGQYLFLTDHSGVGNPHAKPHVPDYQVERLNRLMIRMIVSELAGRRLAADEVIALERGDGSLPQPDQGPQLPEQQRNPALSATRNQPQIAPKVPGWVILAAMGLGACIVDSILKRSRP
jgi:hypothetical protein